MDCIANMLEEKIRIGAATLPTVALLILLQIEDPCREPVYPVQKGAPRFI